MKTLDRSMSLARARRIITVEAPEWDCVVRLRELSAGQLRDLDADVSKQLSLMIVNDEGERIYTTDEDIAELREMSAVLQNRLLTAAATLNGVSQAAVDEAIKNLLTDPNQASASG